MSLPSASTRPSTSVSRPSRLSLRSLCSAAGEPSPSRSAFSNTLRIRLDSLPRSMLAVRVL